VAGPHGEQTNTHEGGGRCNHSRTSWHDGMDGLERRPGSAQYVPGPTGHGETGTQAETRRQREHVRPGHSPESHGATRHQQGAHRRRGKSKRLPAAASRKLGHRTPLNRYLGRWKSHTEKLAEPAFRHRRRGATRALTEMPALRFGKAGGITTALLEGPPHRHAILVHRVRPPFLWPGAHR